MVYGRTPTPGATWNTTIAEPQPSRARIDRGAGAIYASPPRREKITAMHRSPAWVIAFPDGTASRRLEVGFSRLRATPTPPALPFTERTTSSGHPASWVAAW